MDKEIKGFSFNGRKFSMIKFLRVVAKKGGGIRNQEMHVVTTDAELKSLYRRLHERFGNEQLMAVKVSKKIVKPKSNPNSETVPLFGCFDEEVEI